MSTNINAESIGLLILLVIGMFAIIGGVGYFVYRKIAESDPTKSDTSIDPSITTAQEFLQFQDIKDGVIDLGSHRYRAVIECSSVNYNLKTPTEKEMIEVGYEQFINSLKFPITMFIQTRVIDSTYIARTLEKDMEVVRKKFPKLEDYMDLYLDSMKNLKQYLPNTKHKKKYVIIPYDDSYLMPDLEDNEKYDYSISELKNRVEIIKRGLEGVGINCKILDTRDIIEMVYAAYHKEHFSPEKVDALTEGDFFTLLTTGENRYGQLSSAMKMDIILNETQNKIRKDILLSSDINKELKTIYKEIYGNLDDLRDKVGGHYKEGKSKLNVYDNNISRYNFKTVTETVGLCEIEEDDVKVSKNKRTPTQTVQSKMENVMIPEYGKDVYEEKGFLDKYDIKEKAQKQIENDSKKYNKAFEISQIHKKEFGSVIDEGLVNRPHKQPQSNDRTQDETAKSQKLSRNTKKSISQKDNYYDENISNNNIPNFEVKVKELEKNNFSTDAMKSLHDWGNDFGFDSDEEDIPNTRTRDLSFFGQKDDKKNK